MAVHYLHWCPNGCGKSVIYWNIKEGYRCNRCHKHFNREELEKYDKF